MFSPNRISLGELAKAVVLERLERPGDCKVQLHIDEDGEYIQIYGQGRVSTIYVSGVERRKGYVRQKREEHFDKMLEFERFIAKEIEEKGFIDKEGFSDLLERHYKEV